MSRTDDKRKKGDEAFALVKKIIRIYNLEDKIRRHLEVGGHGSKPAENTCLSGTIPENREPELSKVSIIAGSEEQAFHYQRQSGSSFASRIKGGITSLMMGAYHSGVSGAKKAGKGLYALLGPPFWKWVDDGIGSNNQKFGAREIGSFGRFSRKAVPWVGLSALVLMGYCTVSEIVSVNRKSEFYLGLRKDVQGSILYVIKIDNQERIRLYPADGITDDTRDFAEINPYAKNISNFVYSPENESLYFTGTQSGDYYDSIFEANLKTGELNKLGDIKSIVGDQDDYAPIRNMCLMNETLLFRIGLAADWNSFSLDGEISASEPEIVMPSGRLSNISQCGNYRLFTTEKGMIGIIPVHEDPADPGVYIETVLRAYNNNPRPLWLNRDLSGHD